MDLDLIIKEIEKIKNIVFSDKEVDDDETILYFDFDVMNDDVWSVIEYLDEEYEEMLDDGRIEEFTKSEVDRTILDVLEDYYLTNDFVSLSDDIEYFLGTEHNLHDVRVIINVAGEMKMADLYWEENSIE